MNKIIELKARISFCHKMHEQDINEFIEDSDNNTQLNFITSNKTDFLRNQIRTSEYALAARKKELILLIEDLRFTQALNDLVKSSSIARHSFRYLHIISPRMAFYTQKLLCKTKFLKDHRSEARLPIIII